MGNPVSDDSLACLRAGLETSFSGRFVDDCGPLLREATESESGFGSYKILRELNRGATATVYEAVDCSNGRKVWEKAQRVALKVLTTLSDGSFCIPASAIQREISCSSRFQHQHIVSLLDVVASEQRLALALELVNGPDLLEFVEQCGRKLPEYVASHYFRQLLEATTHMHANGIAHRDIKPENCMIDLQKHTLKVTDFGLAAPFEARVPLGCGTVYTIAPECIAQKGKVGYNEAGPVDAWGLGVTLYIILCGRFPFQDSKRPQDDQRTLRNTLDGRMNRMPSRVSPTAQHLVQGLLQVDPSKRFTLAEIWRHPFLAMDVCQQKLDAYQVENFAGRYGVPRAPEAEWKTQLPPWVSGEEAPNFLMDRYLQTPENSPHQALMANSPLTAKKISTSSDSSASENDALPSLQQELVRAALHGSNENSPASTPIHARTPPHKISSPQDDIAEPVDSEDLWGSPESPTAAELSDCCSPRTTPHGAKKLFTLSADACSESAAAAMPPLLVNKCPSRLAPVPEVSESAELDDMRTGSITSSLSWRSESTTFDSPYNPTRRPTKNGKSQKYTSNSHQAKPASASKGTRNGERKQSFPMSGRRPGRGFLYDTANLEHAT